MIMIMWILFHRFILLLSHFGGRSTIVDKTVKIDYYKRNYLFVLFLFILRFQNGIQLHFYFKRTKTENSNSNSRLGCTANYLFLFFSCLLLPRLCQPGHIGTHHTHESFIIWPVKPKTKYRDFSVKVPN